MRDVVAGLAAQRRARPGADRPGDRLRRRLPPRDRAAVRHPGRDRPARAPRERAAPAAARPGSGSPSFPASQAVCGGRTMRTGAITGYIDVAQLVLYVFWVFFAGLIYYLRREDKREGYPLDHRPLGPVTVQGFPPDARAQDLPAAAWRHAYTRRRTPARRPADHGQAGGGPGPGAPLQPTGDPMRGRRRAGLLRRARGRAGHRPSRASRRSCRCGSRPSCSVDAAAIPTRAA